MVQGVKILKCCNDPIAVFTHW